MQSADSRDMGDSNSKVTWECRELAFNIDNRTVHFQEEVDICTLTKMKNFQECILVACHES